MNEIEKTIEQTKHKDDLHRMIDSVEDGDLCLVITRTNKGNHRFSWYGRTWASERLGLLHWAVIETDKYLRKD